MALATPPSSTTASNAMREAVAQIADVLNGMWKYRWLALAVSWIAAIVAVTIALRIPNQYEASARPGLCAKCVHGTSLN
jgi:uncharacterized protein involved in exopolysaccharide biosynthesis